MPARRPRPGGRSSRGGERSPVDSLGGPARRVRGACRTGCGGWGGWRLRFRRYRGSLAGTESKPLQVRASRILQNRALRRDRFAPRHCAPAFRRGGVLLLPLGTPPSRRPLRFMVRPWCRGHAQRPAVPRTRIRRGRHPGGPRHFHLHGPASLEEPPSIESRAQRPRRRREGAESPGRRTRRGVLAAGANAREGHRGPKGAFRRGTCGIRGGVSSPTRIDRDRLHVEDSDAAGREVSSFCSSPPALVLRGEAGGAWSALRCDAEVARLSVHSGKATETSRWYSPGYGHLAPAPALRLVGQASSSGRSNRRFWSGNSHL